VKTAPGRIVQADAGHAGGLLAGAARASHATQYNMSDSCCQGSFGAAHLEHLTRGV
jgi:hypothetical protein